LPYNSSLKCEKTGNSWSVKKKKTVNTSKLCTNAADNFTFLEQTKSAQKTATRLTAGLESTGIIADLIRRPVRDSNYKTPESALQAIQDHFHCEAVNTGTLPLPHAA
jgi:hexokinase